MSWDDVIIGKGNRGNTAVVVLRIEGGANISHNNTSFWITNVFLGLGLTIFKDTEEGVRLKNMLQTNWKHEDIQAWLEKLLLKKINVDKLRNTVSTEIREAFRKGREDKAAEFRMVLGVR